MKFSGMNFPKFVLLLFEYSCDVLTLFAVFAFFPWLVIGRHPTHMSSVRC